MKTEYHWESEVRHVAHVLKVAGNVFMIYWEDENKDEGCFMYTSDHDKYPVPKEGDEIKVQYAVNSKVHDVEFLR